MGSYQVLWRSDWSTLNIHRLYISGVECLYPTHEFFVVGWRHSHRRPIHPLAFTRLQQLNGHNYGNRDPTLSRRIDLSCYKCTERLYIQGKCLIRHFSILYFLKRLISKSFIQSLGCEYSTIMTYMQSCWLKMMHYSVFICQPKVKRYSVIIMVWKYVQFPRSSS